MNQKDMELLNFFLTGKSPLSGNDKADLEAARGLGDGLDAMDRTIRNSFPSISKEDHQRVVTGMLGISLISGDLEPEKAAQAVSAVLQALVKLEVPWAVAFSTAQFEDLLRPSYNKATKAGVDPVDFMRADLGITKEQAAKAVVAFTTEAASK